MKKLIFGLVPCLAASSFANFVTNGSFENPGTAGVFTTYGAGNSGITGWTIGGDSVDLIGSYWTAADGVQSIDLAGNNDGILSQSVSGLVAGQVYHLSFSFSGNPAGGDPLKAAHVTVSDLDAFAAFDTVVEANTLSNMGWQLFEADFTAGSSNVLKFESLQGSAFGLALDNVKIESVPEPATMAILGMGAVGLLRRRNKKA